jgi:hypothetical protein
VDKDPTFGRSGSKAYPEPLARPSYPPSTNGTAWWPIDDCSNASKLIGWPSSYLSFALANGSQRLYTAGSDAQLAFALFWTRVVRVLVFRQKSVLENAIRFRTIGEV